MKTLLIFVLLTHLEAAVAPSDSDPAEAYRQHLMEPQRIAQWEKEAARDCRGESAECLPAYMAARYSQAAALVCRRQAAAEFVGHHGGTVTSFAQHSIRSRCRASIEFCRGSWLNYRRISRSDAD